MPDTLAVKRIKESDGEVLVLAKTTPDQRELVRMTRAEVDEIIGKLDAGEKTTSLQQILAKKPGAEANPTLHYDNLAGEVKTLFGTEILGIVGEEREPYRAAQLIAKVLEDRAAQSASPAQ